MKKVLVTGATGFVGNHVVEYLLQQNVHVITTSASETKARQMGWFGKVQYIPFDFNSLNDVVDYYNFLGKPDVMIHLAWEGLPDYKNSIHVEKNLVVHKRLLANMIEHGLKDLTVSGTCLEYGLQNGCLTEDVPTIPNNAYAVAKDMLHKFIAGMQEKHSFSFKWARLFYMYGSGQNSKSLLSQLKRALDSNEPVFNMSGGEQVRDFLPVEDVAAYIVKIALQSKMEGTINCCSGQPVTVRQFVENYLQSQNRSIRLNFGYFPYPDYEPMYFWGDNTKLKTILQQ